MNADTILAVDGLTKHFGGIAAVDHASLDVRRRSITALIGPNGAGKTTLFNLLTGFHTAESGRVRFLGERIDGRPPYAVTRRGLVRTFQITKALTKMSVLDNMLLAEPRHPGERFWPVWVRPATVRSHERDARRHADELLDAVGLSDMAAEYAGTLSGGQRKLLELARALMTRPTMLLLDEPMAGVNPTLGRRIFEHIERLRDDDGLTVLYIEHDMDVVMHHSERVIVMADGKVIADGPPERVRTDRAVIDAYLGAGFQDRGST